MRSFSFVRRAPLVAAFALLALSSCSKGEEPASTPESRVASGTPSQPSGPPPVFDKNFLEKEPAKYSQFREEVIIRYYFRDRRGGFFLDVGAAEPDQETTTHYLAKELGWKGIAIDARAELAPQYAKHRPNTKFFAYFVSDRSDAEETLYHGANVSSANKDSVKSFVKDPNWEPIPVKVTTITLNDLLAREKVEKIDFLSMDIETYEPQALAGFDIDRYRPDLVCIEAAPQTQSRILEYFAKHGYRRIDAYLKHDWVNWYFEPVAAAKAR